LIAEGEASGIAEDFDWDVFLARKRAEHGLDADDAA